MAILDLFSEVGHRIGQLLPLGLELLERGCCRLVCCVAALLEISKLRAKCCACHCSGVWGFTAAA